MCEIFGMQLWLAVVPLNLTHFLNRNGVVKWDRTVFEANRPNKDLPIDVHVDFAHTRLQLNPVARDQFISADSRQIEGLAGCTQLQTHVGRKVLII